MAFDKPTRNALAKMVAACRERLTADISDQLQSTFGLYPDGTRLGVARTEADKHATAELHALLDYFIASDASGEKNPRNAYQRLVREIGFTTLNRLAALRLSEERGLVIECVRRGMDSDGFRLFDRVANGALGTRYATYRAFIEGMYDELGSELPALFDRHHPHSHVFPGETALNEVLALLNDPDLAKHDIWKQDETIGWIYQYYNDPTERKKMRDESQAPRNSRELAVRNQFFTPRYVVEFLTDNTLGRIWFEMCGGNTKLAEMCRYLVKNSSGVRAKKDPRDLKILDPACGSGHFLLYAFDLLLRIYEEAWADASLPLSLETGTLLRDDYPDLDSLRRAVPGLVLRHNLYGIDIDPRAAQIAALALWLRAQRAYLELRLKPDERPVIQKTNIVTAEPMPGDPALLEDFLAMVEVPFIQKLVGEVFDKMTLAGEAGSLLKIEEEIRDSIAAAKQAWLKRPKNEHLILWQEEKQHQAEQLALFEGITDESFWEQAEKRVLDALRDYARHADNGKGMRRKLFAEDAERGFAFVDLCQKRFDAILMNPPFGKGSKNTLAYFEENYPDNWKDIYAIFFERSEDLLNSGGTVGAITSLLYLYSKQLRVLRKNFIKRKKIKFLVELGGGVLDSATVDTVLTVLNSNEQPKTLFLDLTDSQEKNDDLLDAINFGKFSKQSLDRFENIFNSPLCYHLSQEKLDLWSTNERVEPELATIVAGNHTFDDERFLRLRYEIPSIDIENVWFNYEKGGEYKPFFSPSHLVFKWGGEGKEPRAYQKLHYGTDAQTIQSISWWFKPGLTYPRISSAFGVRVLSEGFIFSEKGMCIFPNDINNGLSLLAILSSSWIEDLLNAFGRHRAYENSAVANLPIGHTILNSVKNELERLAMHSYKLMYEAESEIETSPVFVCPKVALRKNEGTHNKKSELKSNLDKIDVLVGKVLFGNTVSALVSAKRSSLVDGYFNELSHSDKETQSRLLSYVVGCIFSRWDVRFGLDQSFSPSPLAPFSKLPPCMPGMLLKVDGFPASANNIVSEYWLRARPNIYSLPSINGSPENIVVEWQGKTYPATISDEEYPVKIAWDGILVDDPGLDGHTLHPSDIIRRVRDVLEVLWKDNHAEIEAEACEILGVKDLRDYFRKPSGFFADHLKRYSKSRRQAPIYWPLSTPSGSYTLWIYYHRLSDEILFTAVNRYVDPKIEQVERRVNAIQMELGQLSGKSTTEMRDQLDELRGFLTELRQFREELLRIANLPYKPDLNDGVILNAAPFHRLFRLSKWAKDTESTWKKLEAGEYDWAHIAYVLYPDRVRDVCKRDKSIAIAHGLESLYEGKEEVKKRKKKSKKDEEEQDDMEID